MPPNRITRGGAMLAGALLIILLVGCGGGASSTGATAPSPTFAATPSSEESVDAAILDTVLARQEAAVAAQTAAIPHLAPTQAKLATYFRTQEQEHIDGVLRAIRALVSPAEPEAEEIEVPEAKTEAEWLAFLYELESKTIEKELTAIADLESGSPRTLLAATVADQAQHLTLLRQALGAGSAASIPGPFEDGTAPAP